MVAILAAIAALSAGARAAPLPLGPRALTEARKVHRLDDGVTWTHITRGPNRVDVLEVEDGERLGVLTANDKVPGLERPSAMATRHDAIAGVNGGYFSAEGDPTGVVSTADRLLSEPVGPRTAFTAPDRIGPVRWHGKLTVRGKSRIVDGVNRTRGRIPACGGVGGDEPTEKVDPSTICTDPSELVVLTPEYSGRVPSDSVRIDGGYVLTGSGDAARFLDRIRPEDHPKLQLGIQGTVLGGAPRLLRNGRIHITAKREGRAADTARRPRTVAGVEADGRVLLVTIDGRGATLREAATTIRALGARDAMALDSGSSTTMVVGGESVTGDERPVADGLFVLRAR